MASKKPCKYGGKCYRRNPQHLREYSHPSDEQQSEQENIKRKKVTDENDTESEPKKTKGNDTKTVVQQSDPLSSEKSTHEEEQKVVNETTDSSSGIDSEEGEEEDIPSPANVRDNIKQKYLMDMPEDFYQFWEFCKKQNGSHPENAMKSLLGWTLVGPYDILAGKHKGVNKNKKGRRPKFLLHYRYYYDPPEFMTVVKGDKDTQFHIGYFRDEPSEMPVFVAVNQAKDSCKITPKGENIFGAVKNIIDEELKSADQDQKKKLKDFQNQLIDFAKSRKLCLDLQSNEMKKRNKKVVCKTFHGAGIVVPVDKNEVGYRPVPETPADLKKMFKKVVESKSKEERDKNMDPIQELITLVQFANDECDYGEGLELGMDLFSFGGEVLHPLIQHLLPLAYQLLGRFEFKDIIELHLKNRSHNVNNELEM
ncbi:histone PARylation factor 1-like [Saccostrea echinata]|uniref:histone PARylation factor 1-like n=1 Tax=Saccostrea echinata TaxID=191078 RepID=UPI002A82C4B2|nr:histone PARylation factor 1-like [Saccostrea echinata]